MTNYPRREVSMPAKPRRVHQNKYEEGSQKAQQENKKLWDCERKRAYKTEANAKGNGGWEVYQCPHCSKWHRRTPLHKKVKKLVASIHKARRYRSRCSLTSKGVPKTFCTITISHI